MHYIELNPVRAAMVADPGGYRWSSYWHNGLGQANVGVVEHPLYQGLDIGPEQRQAIYRALFRSELDDDAIGDIRLALTQSQPLGDDRFAERICAKVGVRRAHQRRGRPPGLGEGAYGVEKQMGFGF